ncbi:hypothetical protein ACFV0T_40105 [Streptomyces sp. NPDC059582]|uniref:hypothetical protein n=1 Tax=Streptomyces sp. NPDC059582 TaxID=3346875 RepID=UPI0036B3DBD7
MASATGPIRVLVADDPRRPTRHAGARGLLLKGAQQEEIRTTIRSVAAGQFVVAPLVAALLIGHLEERPNRRCHAAT